MSACEHETRFDLDTELAIARGALDQGDLRHAVHHLSGVLIEAPESLEAESLVQRVFVAARDPLAIVGDFGVA